jgi:pimeloyl-ACP methyl ester carboxylesterase
MFDFENWNCRVDGSGTPLLLVNGQFSSRASWDVAVESLARFYKVLTIEFPNQNFSPTDLSFDTMDKYAKFLQEYLAWLDIDSKEVIAHGYSFGGNVLRYMSKALNVKFKALLFGGVASTSLKPFHLARSQAWLEVLRGCSMETFASIMLLQSYSPGFVAKNPDRFRRIVADYAALYAGRADALEALIRANHNFIESVEPGAERYDEPVYLIGSESDLIMPMNYVHEYAKEIGANQVFTLPGGHASRVEHPEALINIIHEVCARHE